MGEFGLRVQAMTARGTAAYHLSPRRAMDDLFGLSISVGAMANWSRRRGRP
jgi:hypothetical protein